jgi:hypothetical protein
MADFPYSVHRNREQGVDVVTRLSDKANIPIDPDDSDFCQFLQELNKGSPFVDENRDLLRDYIFPDNSRFFCCSTKGDLIRHLKEQAIMLYAESGTGFNAGQLQLPLQGQPSDEKHRIRIKTGGGRFSGVDGPVRNLVSDSRES